jgi:tetratricopeptide (TPR) repeat protein
MSLPATIVCVLTAAAGASAANGPLAEGRAQFLSANYKQASELFEKAVAADPANSDAYLWLGRSYGRRAETASVFSAPGLATKSRQAFEKAVELNPNNKEALNDLFEYYLQAPGFLGGGEDKALKLIDRIAALDPAEGYFARARLAEHRKEFKAAEVQLRRAIDVAPRQIGRVIDLAKLLARQGKVTESDEVFEQARKIDPNAPQLLFSRAETYIQAKRNLPEARELLERYLAAPRGPDDPPSAEAKKLLRQAGGE